MIRKIIRIDEEKCNGCGACASACQEKAIALKEGKARLIRDDYCDGLGNCLPQCPTGAITFEEREAAPFDEEAVKENMKKEAADCPGARPQNIRPKANETFACGAGTEPSQLRNWPVQIKLAPLQAPCFAGAELLLAADCTAYAYASFHRDFLQGKTALIGCPKLDGIDYSEKLAELIRRNELRSLTVVRMEVPCCGGLEAAVKRVLAAAGKKLPLEVITVAIDGKILKGQ